MKRIFTVLALLSFVVNISMSATSTITHAMDNRINDLEMRLGDIEINQALRKFSFGGTFTNQLEYYSRAAKSTNMITGYNRVDATDTHLNPAMMKLDFNIDAHISNGLNFFSTIGMAKYYNLSNRNKRNTIDTSHFISFAGSNNLKDSGAHFDMAYISYNPKESPWTIAIGRMPTNNGPPLNQADGNSRSGTYPSFAFNNILDGVAGIYDFKKYLATNHSFKMRFFYTPLIRASKNDKATQEIDGTPSSGEYGGSGEQIASNGFMGTFLSEYSIDDLGWTKKLDVFFTSYRVSQFFSATQQKLPTATPGIPAELKHDGIEYFDSTSHTLYIGANRFLNSDFNVSFTYTSFLLTYTGDDYKSDNYMATLNYTFNNKLNSGDILGIEYIHTDKNRVPSEETTFFTNGFYNMMNGEGYHLYYTKVLDTNQLIRLGYFSYYTRESRLLLRDVNTTESASYLRWSVFF